MASPRSRYPGPWQGPFIKLNLYLPSGEFVCEHNVYVEDRVWDFLLHLEEGVITPDLDLGDTDYGGSRDYFYILVWNGMVLDDNVGFADIVRDHGMSETVPNDITVVKRECPKLVHEGMFSFGTFAGSEDEDT